MNQPIILRLFTIVPVFLLTFAHLSLADGELKKSIHKLDKKRFEKFSDASGSVYLPTLGLSFEESAKGMVCEPQLKSMTETLKMMDAQLNDEDRKNTQAIVGLIAKCTKGEYATATAIKKTDSDINFKVTPPQPVDPGSTAPGSGAKTPTVSAGKTWK